MAYNITKIKPTSTIKKILFLVAIIVCLIIINGLLHSIYNLWQKQDLVVKAKEELNREILANQELRVQLSYVKSDQFIEQEARNKLFMVKEGENSVIVPPDLIKKKGEKKEIVLVPWQQWINLFVGK